MKRWITLGMVILLVLPCAQTSFASVRKKKTVATETKKEPVKRQSKYDKLVKNKLCETAQGNFVTLHKVEGKVYFEIPVKYYWLPRFPRQVIIICVLSVTNRKTRCTLNSRKRIVLFSCVRWTCRQPVISTRDISGRWWLEVLWIRLSTRLRYIVTRMTVRHFWSTWLLCLPVIRSD